MGRQRQQLGSLQDVVVREVGQDRQAVRRKVLAHPAAVAEAPAEQLIELHDLLRPDHAAVAIDQQDRARELRDLPSADQSYGIRISTAIRSKRGGQSSDFGGTATYDLYIGVPFICSAIAAPTPACMASNSEL